MNEAEPGRARDGEEPWLWLAMVGVLVIVVAMAVQYRGSALLAPNSSRRPVADAPAGVVTYHVSGPDRARSIAYNVGGHVFPRWKITHDTRLPWYATTTFSGGRARELVQLAATAPAGQQRKIRLQIIYRGRPVAFASARPGRTADTLVDLGQLVD